MTNSPFLSRIFALTTGMASTLLLASCSSATVGHRVPLTWHSGFTLPTLLAKPRPAATKVDIQHMLSEPWYEEFVVVPKWAVNEDETIALSSCTQYLAQAPGELEPVQAWEGTPYMELAMMCVSAREILVAQPGYQSNIPRNFIAENLPELLPPEVAMVISTTEWEHLSADKSIRSWADVAAHYKWDMRATVHDTERATFADEGGRQTIELVARGDFNGDGLEDVLFTSRDSVEGGSYSAVRLFQVTRRKAEGRYELVKEYRY